LKINGIINKNKRLREVKMDTTIEKRKDLQALEFLEENFPYRLARDTIEVIKNRRIRRINKTVCKAIIKAMKKGEKGLYLYGKVGIGKSVSILLCLFKLYKEGYISTVKYVSLYDIWGFEDLERLKEDYNEYKAIYSKFQYDILIIDDANANIFRERPNLMKQAIYELYNIPAKFTIVVSNVSLQNLKEVFKNYDGVIVSRFLGFFSDIKELKGEDLRNKELIRKIRGVKGESVSL
jgi:DNA replication protein DnaC